MKYTIYTDFRFNIFNMIHDLLLDQRNVFCRSYTEANFMSSPDRRTVSASSYGTLAAHCLNKEMYGYTVLHQIFVEGRFPLARLKCSALELVE